MREVGDEKLDELSVKTDMECCFGFANDQPDVIKDVLNQVYLAIPGLIPRSEEAAIHLAKNVWKLKRKVSWLSEKNRERRSTIDGMTEHESDVGMVLLASRISPSMEQIKDFAFEKTIEHPDGMSKQQCADLYSHRPEIFEFLLQGLQEQDWAKHFRTACLIVLEDCAYERAEAERKQAEVEQLLGEIDSEQRQSIDLDVIERPEIEEEVVVIEEGPGEAPDVSRETLEAEEDEIDG